MKRKALGSVMVAVALACLMGASTISFDAGQPTPNPRGGPGTIQAKGTYSLDPGHSVSGISFTTDDGSTAVSDTAKWGAGTWTTGVLTSAKGNLTCTAELTVDDGQKIWIAGQAQTTVTVK